MPSRIATGPFGDPDRLKALILAQPSLVEPGFRVLDTDLGAGAAGPIDLIGVCASGSLALVAVGSGDLDGALLRLLDQHLWAADQRDLLLRLYAGAGVAANKTIRGFLVSHAFTHPFLRRLSLLAVPLTPLLARPLLQHGESAVLIEPAGPIFGLDALEPRRGPRFEPEAAGVEIVVDEPVPVMVETAAGQESHGEPHAVAEEAGTADPFETLTLEEIEEFARFDRHRRERDNGPS